jgi:hypothetical protein
LTTRVIAERGLRAEEAMAARDRWVLVEENGDLWLLKREGPEVRVRSFPMRVFAANFLGYTRN